MQIKTGKSRQIQMTDAEEAIEYYFQQGWTDGLPVVPPTPEKVGAMLKQVKMEGPEIIGAIPERNLVITAEKVAINAVMAGCLPAYMPVVTAAVEAVLDPAFGVHGPTASTGGSSILLMINGPIIKQINLNTGKNFMGTGHRANATIGRAMRLVLLNAGGTREFDQSTLGHPGKLSFCIAEAECEEWLPLHVERGFKREDSTVTVFASEGPHQVNNHIAQTPEGILLSMADRMTALATFNMQLKGTCVVVVCPEHQQTLLEHGWDKSQVRAFLFEHARRPKNDLYRFGLRLDPSPNDHQEWLTPTASPEDILILSGGGVAGRFSAFIPGWGGLKSTKPITKKIVSSGFT